MVVGAYSYLVLFLMLFARVQNQWSRQTLGYAYGYQGVGSNAGDPKYEIAQAFPTMNAHYGLLSGAAFTIAYSISGIFAG